jgi:hypothetical protein
MKIKKEHLRTVWFEDKDGNYISEPDYKNNDLDMPSNAEYQVSRFPLELTTKHLKLIHQKEVNKCNHPRRYIKKTGGWADGIYGRECTLCGGSQTRKKWHLWPKKWEGYGSKKVVSFHSGYSEGLALAIANSGDYTLSEAIIISAISCERCMNALAYKYGLDWGYEEGREKWEKAGTSCQFCEKFK